MDLSYKLCTVNHAKSHDLTDAKRQFFAQYPGITYDEVSGDFIYRGFRFHYFKAGVSMYGGQDSFLLVDKDNHRNWLFDFDDKEYRWNDFLQQRAEKRLPIEKDLHLLADLFTFLNHE